MKLNLGSPTIQQYIAVLVANFGILTTGMSLAWPSPILIILRNGTATPLSRPITEEEGSWIVSGGYLFSIFMNLLAGYLFDKIGRKYSIILVSFPKMCTAILLIFVTEVWMLIACRIIMVLADSCTLVIVPVYVTEIACKEHRGSLGTFVQIFATLGMVITLSIGPFLTYVAMNIFLATVIAVTTIPLLFLPDSPFYLLSKGREEEAFKLLSQIRDTDVVIKEELEDYKSLIEEKKFDKIALFKNKTFLKSLALGCLVCGGSKLIGFNAVSFYLQTILETTRTSVKPEIASVIIGFIQLFAAFNTTFLTNKFKRRTILISSIFGIFCGLIGLGTFFKIRESDDDIIPGFMNYLPVISLIIVIYSYSAGIGSLLWLVTAELFDRQARALGVSSSLASISIIIFLTTRYFTEMTIVLGPAGTYFFFSAMCVLIGSLIAIFLPETKGKSFNEIQAVLGGESIKLRDRTKENKKIFT